MSADAHDERARDGDLGRESAGGGAGAPGTGAGEPGSGSSAAGAEPDEAGRGVCELCGGPTLERHCKIVCLNCGFRRDCSDP